MAEDDDQKPLEGITDDTPDEITSWIRENEVAENYTVMLKEVPEGGGKAVYMRSHTNRCPSINDLGKEWGPGKYKLVFSWRGENKAGKKEQMTKEMEVELPERAWRDIFEEATEERRRLRLEKKSKQWEEDAVKAKVQGNVHGTSQTPPTSEIDVLRKALEVAKSLGINVGGTPKTEKAEPKKSFTETLIDMAPAITALGGVISPIVLALIGRPKEKSDTTMLNTLLAHALNKKEDGGVKEMMPFLLGTMKQIFEVKESMTPEAPESLVERILGKLVPMVPMVLAMAGKGPAAVENNPVVGMVRNSADFKDLAGSLEAQILAVQELDQRYGFQQTNEILMVAKIQRPVELADNYKKYPSNGYRLDGLSEAEYADLARKAPVADSMPPKSVDGTE